MTEPNTWIRVGANNNKCLKKVYFTIKNIGFKCFKLKILMLIMNFINNNKIKLNHINFFKLKKVKLFHFKHIFYLL